jgi:hypothetical protein
MVYNNDYPANYGWTVICGYNSDGFVEPIFYCPFCGINLMKEVTVINPKRETKEDDERND